MTVSLGQTTSASAPSRWREGGGQGSSLWHFGARAALMLLVSAVGVFSVAVFFRTEILNGFSVLRGNRYDQVIELAILEHWFNVFRGLSHWSETGYFYPARLTLGYNDGYFLYGAIYSLFRAARLDPYLSGECVSIALRLIGFFGFYWAARRVLDLRASWALLSAVLFTISNNMFVQAHHAQLLSVGFAPLMAVLLDGMLAALLRGRRAPFLLWGIAAALLYSAWLLTAYYMAWYFLLFVVFMGVAYAFLAGRGGLLPWWNALRRHAAPSAIILLVLGLSSAPFLSVYLRKANETGMHPWHAVRYNTLTLPDLLHVGDGNLLYGRIVAFANHAIRPTMPAWSERMTGFPPGLLWLFGWGAIAVLLTREALVPGRAAVLRALVIATLVTWALAFNIDGHSAWWFIYETFPGAKAARVVARYQLFLAAPVIGIAVLYLATSARTVALPVLLLVCGLLVAEEINTAAAVSLDRRHELARLDAVPRPPPGCKAFFASAARPEGLLGPEWDGFYSHNVDAMIIAETLHLPTINGASTFQPPGWQLSDPDRPDYLDRVRRYAVANRVTRLCGLDLKTMRWQRFPLAGARSP